MTDYASLALQCGFTNAAPLDVGSLHFLSEVRDMCRADRCRNYGKSWSCPPACGDLAFWTERAKRYDSGLLLQTVGEIEDSYDFEGMQAVSALNKQQVDALADALHAADADFLLMAAGTCKRCEKCTYPDAPCRFPDKLFPSMEACGLFVSQVCRDNGVDYYYGSDRIAYTCCLLYNKE